ncbi:MAG: DUF3656 domain-containing U32 family peptidase [Eubacteriaceae bacterium]
MKKKPEILAPVGTMESVIPAINAGANAIYFGGKSFSARQNAGNMTNEEIEIATKLCHSQGVKVYVTLNTLIKNSEIPLLLEFLYFLETINIDGLIIQDIGVIYLLQKYFPAFKLQTSTQVSIYGLDGVLFFENLGFSRVVLPREMSLSDVAEIKKKAKIELKIFCHGALCYGYSGQCLMSSMIGGRSGNRGLCAQPCRKKYRLIRETTNERNQNQEVSASLGYLLSPKDLNTLKKMREIVDIGVDSLKIEGRMKTPEYVFGITRAYREAVDAIFLEEEKKSLSELEIKQLFNRDFTLGHLFDDKNIINSETGKNRGILIGEVVKFPKISYPGSHPDFPLLGIRLKPECTLICGDGISFGEDGNIGTKVDGLFSLLGKVLDRGRNDEIFGIPCRHRIASGTKVYKNFDKSLMTSLKIEGNKVIEFPKESIDFQVEIKEGMPVKIIGKSHEGYAEFVSDFIPEKALKNPLTQEMVEAQLSRLGGTPFELGKVMVILDENLFLSRGQLNFLRKAVIDKLEKNKEKSSLEIIREKEVPLLAVLKNKNNQKGYEKKKISLKFSILPSPELLKSIPEDLLDEIVLPIGDCANEGVLENIGIARQKFWDILITFPRVMNTEETRRIYENWPPKRFIEEGIKGILVENYEVLSRYRHSNLYLEGGLSFNLFNTLASQGMKEWGFQSGVLSLELDYNALDEISRNGRIETVLPVYGRQELMISKKCVFNCERKEQKGCVNCCQVMQGELVDERGNTFPVERDSNGYIHIYNGNKLFLREEILGLKQIKTLRIDHQNESLEVLKKILTYYKKNIYEGNQSLPEGLTTEKTTRGALKRGVK